MLSQAIDGVASSLEEEFANGATLSPAMQWQLVTIIRRWQVMALVLERSMAGTSVAPKPAFRPTVVGGTDFEAAVNSSEETAAVNGDEH